MRGVIGLRVTRGQLRPPGCCPSGCSLCTDCAGAVDPRRLVEAGRDPLCAGDEQHHAEAVADPGADETDGRVFIEALRDLEPGEELFYDYGLVIDGLAYDAGISDGWFAAQQAMTTRT